MLPLFDSDSELDTAIDRLGQCSIEWIVMMVLPEQDRHRLVDCLRWIREHGSVNVSKKARNPWPKEILHLRRKQLVNQDGTLNRARIIALARRQHRIINDWVEREFSGEPKVLADLRVRLG